MSLDRLKSKPLRDTLYHMIPNYTVTPILYNRGVITEIQRDHLLKCTNNYDANKLLLETILLNKLFGICEALVAVGQFALLTSILDNVEVQTEKETIFPDMKPGESLQQFIDRFLKPSETFNEECREAFEHIKKRLQEHKDLKDKIEIFQAGSFAKGTHVTNFSDLDVVVVLKEVKTVADLMKDIDKHRLTIVEALKAKSDGGKSNPRIILADKTHSCVIAVCIEVDHTRKNFLSIDLVPTADMGNGKDKLETLYQEMAGKDYAELKHYAKCFSKYLIEFVEHSNNAVKDVIRLLKYWNDQEKLGITATVIELIVIYASEKSTVLEDILLRSLNTLAHYRTLQISFDNHYIPEDYIYNVDPYILDPTNPWNNLHPGASPLANFKSEEVEMTAKELIEKLNSQKSGK